MNIEVEVKVKVDNLEEIKEKVAEKGKLIKSIKQIDEYYIPCHRDFFAEKPEPTEFLRIRTNPDKVIFEYDKAIGMQATGDYDRAEEYETEVLNPDELRKILGFLDFKKVVTVEKHREYWMCGDIEVALDRIEGLGTFMEAEAKGDFKTSAEAKEACINFLENLGIGNVDENQVKKGYLVLVMESKK